jgi:hypothetical protein
MFQDGDRLAWLSQQHPTIRGLPSDVAGRAVAGERAFVLAVVLGCCRLLLGGRQGSGARGEVPRKRVPPRFLPEHQRTSMWREPVLLAQGLYYRRMATLALQLACTPPSGPPRNSHDFLRRLDVRKLQQLWRGDQTAQADLEQLAADPQVLAGVRGRYSAFFRALQDTADGRWGLEDVDLAVLTIPTIASRSDSDAAVRLVLEDLGHFATRRKARVGDDVLLVLDEFSAVQGGTDQAIHLAERLRDVGVPVIFGAQSPEGLGDERQQWRLLHTIGGGLVLHQLADPDLLVGLAGTVRTPEQAWQLDPWGPADQARVHMADRPRVDPNQVRQLHPGEAFLIQAGRAVKLSVLQAPVPAQVQEEASALRATAMSAAEPVYVAEGIVGAPPQVELWRPNQPVLDQPDQAPLPALEAPQEATAAAEQAEMPALPVLPRQRIMLALRQAIAQRDEVKVAAVVQAGQREEPDWDPTAELARLRAVGRWRRWRRRPSFPRWLARVTHLGRVRRG